MNMFLSECAVWSDSSWSIMHFANTLTATVVDDQRSWLTILALTDDKRELCKSTICCTYTNLAAVNFANDLLEAGNLDTQDKHRSNI